MIWSHVIPHTEEWNNKKHSTTVLRVYLGFDVVYGVWLTFDHNLFRTFLSWIIHFSSPGINLSKNDLLVKFYCNRKSQISTRLIRFLLVSFHIPRLFKWVKTVLWSTSSSLANDINFTRNRATIVRCIYDIRIPGLKTLKQILCYS